MVHRDDWHMNTNPCAIRPISNALRARTADFFKMDVTQPARATPARDSKPLHRSVNPLQGMEFWVSNENMCLGLWELMARC